MFLLLTERLEVKQEQSSAKGVVSTVTWASNNTELLGQPGNLFVHAEIPKQNKLFVAFNRESIVRSGN